MSDVLEQDDIQGLVARGFGRLPHASYLLAQIDDAAAARALLGDWARLRLTPASASPTETAMNVALTSAGLRTLTGARELPAGFSEPYLTGMATDYRSRLLGDVGPNSPSRWQWGGPASGSVHAVVLLFADTQERLTTLRESLTSAGRSGGLRLLAVLDAAKLTDREPFGFLDGISQPVLAGLTPGTPREGEVVRDGEFVLGYVNEYDQRTERPLLRPDADPHRMLPRDPDGSGAADLGRNGSYLVFRQLRQDIELFADFLDRASIVAGQVDPERRERLAAKIVGRWRGTGAPLTLSPDRDDPAHASANDFGFHELDARGHRCPVGAHIRRANPRDSLPPDAGTPASLRVNHRHRLLRRGRTYHSMPDTTGSGPAEQGLHFMCLNTNLARQYEFVQHSWVNDPNFGGLVGVEDPLIGPRRDGPSTFVEPASPVRRRHDGLPQFVQTRGGAYFFLPGLRALRYLTSTPR